MLAEYIAKAYNYGGDIMRAKTLFLIIMIMAYGYYLRTMSAELQRRAEGVKRQYYSAIELAEKSSDSAAMNTELAQYTTGK